MASWSRSGVEEKALAGVISGIRHGYCGVIANEGVIPGVGSVS